MLPAHNKLRFLPCMTQISEDARQILLTYLATLFVFLQCHSYCDTNIIILLVNRLSR